MDPSRSSSLRIGDDSSTVAGSGRVRDASGRSTAVEPRNALGRLLSPWIRIKEKLI